MNSANFGTILVNGAKFLIAMILIEAGIFPNKNLGPPFNKWVTGDLKFSRGVVVVTKRLFFKFFASIYSNTLHETRLQSRWESSIRWFCSFHYSNSGRASFDYKFLIFYFKRLTGAFQQYDVHRNGNALFTYEQFLASVIGSI